MVLEAGAEAPEFELEAAVSGKTITAANGTPTVLVFHGNKTQDAPKTVGKAVRAEHPDAGDVLVVNVVNLKAFGGLWKKAAEAQLKQTYEGMASKLGDDAQEYVVLLPDWDNSVGPAFDVADSDKAPAAVVLDGDGKVLGSAEGDVDGLCEAALSALATADA